MATLNTTEWFGLHDRGAIAPGRRADLIVCDAWRTCARAWSLPAGGWSLKMA
jgi:adenine deaminase